MLCAQHPASIYHQHTVRYHITRFRFLQGKAPVLMPILKGGFIFAADLIRALDPCPEGLVVEFVSARWVPTVYGLAFQ
jgi:hypoxanthine-guanine phosphoribosyltransferase